MHFTTNLPLKELHKSGIWAVRVCSCHQVAAVEFLSPNQKAELILDPDSLASIDKAIVREVLQNLTEPHDDDQLNQFFQAFVNIINQVNTSLECCDFFMQSW